MIREELPGLIKSAVGEEVKKLLILGRVNELSEENNRLKSRIDLVETQLGCQMGLWLKWPLQSLVMRRARCAEVLEDIRNCCNSKLGINISDQNTNTSDFVNMRASYFILPVFSTPSRKGLNNSSCIDNIYTNHPLRHSISKIVIHYISWSSTNISLINLSSAIELGNKPVNALEAQESIAIFGELLSEVDWLADTGLLDEEHNNVTSAYQSFNTRFQPMYDHCSFFTCS